MSKTRIVVNLDNDAELVAEVKKKVIEAIVGVERSEVESTLDSVLKYKLTEAGLQNKLNNAVMERALNTVRYLSDPYGVPGQTLREEVDTLVKRNVLAMMDKFIKNKDIEKIVESILQEKMHEMVQNSVNLAIKSGVVKVKVQTT